MNEILWFTHKSRSGAAAKFAVDDGSSIVTGPDAMPDIAVVARSRQAILDVLDGVPRQHHEDVLRGLRPVAALIKDMRAATAELPTRRTPRRKKRTQR